MKAKLMLFGILMILSGTITNAQKTSFGLRGGVNFYNITGKEGDGDKLDNKLKTGFNLGVNAEVPIGIDFYIQPGVIYSSKGASDVFGTENKINIGYIEVPVNLLYKPDLGTGKLLLGFGPYVAFGIGGNYVFDANGSDKRPIKFKSQVTLAEAISQDNYYLKGFDAGANFLFGYEWSNRFSVQLNAGLGLVDIYTKVENIDPGKTSQKNTGFGVSVGYRFAK
jgi:hypothetical protein